MCALVAWLLIVYLIKFLLFPGGPALFVVTWAVAKGLTVSYNTEKVSYEMRRQFAFIIFSSSCLGLPH